MNDSNSNNKIFGNTNNINNIPTTPVQPMNNNINNVNSTPVINNNAQPQSNTNTVNSIPNFNSVFGVNNTPNSIQNEVTQSSQNLNNSISSQPTNNSSMNNNINLTNRINNNQQYSMPISQNPNQNIVKQPQMQPNQNMNNNIPPYKNFNNTVNDEELLRAFIGNNYEKITTRSFNFAGFFFTTFYMFYRKMFGYSLLFFLLILILLNLIKNFSVIVILNVVVGLLVNKIYLYYANKKIAKIKLKNYGKDINDLKNICSSKGGTSAGKIFLGLLAEIGIVVVVLFVMMIIGISSVFGKLFNINNWNIIINDENNISDSSLSTSGTLLENVSVGGYYCFGSKCNVTIYDSNDNSSDYVLSVNNIDVFKLLGDYADYIKLNIYYDQKENEKTIVDFKIYVKSNNKDISSIKNEDELRNELGLYSTGTYTDSFTLTQTGTIGYGYKDNTEYTYTTYTFVDSKNIEYDMTYINTNGKLNLVKGTKYRVTFEVAKGVFGYEFTIKSVK